MGIDDNGFSINLEPPRDCSGLCIKPGKHYEWLPQEDITAHELSLCISAFFTLPHNIENLPEGARRHFREVE